MKEITVRKPRTIRVVGGAGAQVKHLRRLALLIIPAALVCSMPAVAGASAGARASEAAGARPAAVDAALTAARPAALAATATNTIGNASRGHGGLGVIHVHDGSYTHGTYDAVLPYNVWSDLGFGWTTTAGWYTGPGYCTAQDRSDDGGVSWYAQVPAIGPGQHFIGAHTSYVVDAYRADHC